MPVSRYRRRDQPVVNFIYRVPPRHVSSIYQSRHLQSEATLTRKELQAGQPQRCRKDAFVLRVALNVFQAARKELGVYKLESTFCGG
jgi:hypothetical protein